MNSSEIEQDLFDKQIYPWLIEDLEQQSLRLARLGIVFEVRREEYSTRRIVFYNRKRQEYIPPGYIFEAWKINCYIRMMCCILEGLTFEEADYKECRFLGKYKEDYKWLETACRYWFI